MTSPPRYSTSGLYHLRSANPIDPGLFKITKLDSDYNVESTYLVTSRECTCPAGTRPSCRHRDMLHFFLDASHIDDGWMLDWSSRSWRKPLCEDLREQPIHEQGTPVPPWDDFPGIMIDPIEEGLLSTHPSSPEAAASAEIEVERPPLLEAPLAAASTLKRRRLP